MELHFLLIKIICYTSSCVCSFPIKEKLIIQNPKLIQINIDYPVYHTTVFSYILNYLSLLVLKVYKNELGNCFEQSN